MSVRDREDAVITALRDLAPHLDGEPDPNFRMATRARLVAMAAVRTPEPEPVTGLKRLLMIRAEDAVPSRWRTRLTATLAGAALTVTAAASLVALADNARPGDVLYGLKRGTEQTQLALAGDARGQTLLDFASTRLSELEQLVDQPSALPAAGGAAPTGDTVLAAGADPELVISTLETMDDQTTEGTAWLTDRAVTTRNEAPLDDLAVWAATQNDGLAALAPALPAAAGAAMSHSIELLSEVSARTIGLQGALACSSGPAVGRADALGPVPSTCTPATPGTPSGQPGTGSTGSGAGDPSTTPAVPTAPPGTSGTGGGAGTGGSGSGGTGTGGSGGLPLPGGVPAPGGTTIPGLPSVPTVPLPGGLVPSVPAPSVSVPRSLPGSLPNVSLPGSSSTPLLDVPGSSVPLDACLPPLVTVGDC